MTPLQLLKVKQELAAGVHLLTDIVQFETPTEEEVKTAADVGVTLHAFLELIAFVRAVLQHFLCSSSLCVSHCYMCSCHAVAAKCARKVCIVVAYSTLRFVAVEPSNVFCAFALDSSVVQL